MSQSNPAGKQNRPLKLGDQLDEPLYGRLPGAAAPLLLLAAGHRIETVQQLQRLREAGFAVDLPAAAPPPSKPRRMPEDSAVTADASPQTFEQRMNTAHRLRASVTEAAGGMLERVMHGTPPDMATLVLTSARLAEEVAVDPYAAAAVTHLAGADEYTVAHCADVAILMVAIAGILGYDEAARRHIALGGLVHDVGKQRVPPQILLKPGKLTREEMIAVQRHPQYGYETLCETECPWEVLSVVLQHHERLDGSGYPGRFTRRAIHPYSQIAAVADAFDAMTADRVYHPRIPPRLALGQLFLDRDRLFQADAVSALTKLIGVYPVGTRVVLNTGECGVVAAPNPNDTTRPVVQVDRDYRGNRVPCPYYVSLHGAPQAIVATTG